MRILLLLCAAFALAVAAGPVEEMTDVQQNMQPEEKPDDVLALMTGTFEKEEAVPVAEEEGRTLGDIGQSRNICPTGWLNYGSRCFIFIHREMAWIDAEKYCLRNGANLASIHSLGEHQFIQKVVGGGTNEMPRAWVGGTDAIRDQVWFWSDGSPFYFYDWGVGEPNNHKGIEKCLEINRSEDHLWNDLPCELQLPFVCGTKP